MTADAFLSAVGARAAAARGKWVADDSAALVAFARAVLALCDAPRPRYAPNAATVGYHDALRTVRDLADRHLREPT